MDHPPLSDLRGIVARLGGDLYAGGLAANVPGPGHSRKDRSLSLKIEGGRLLWHSHANDAPEAVWAYLETEGGIASSRGSWRPSRAAPGRRTLSPAERAHKAALKAERERKLAVCARVWAETVQADATPVETYLRGRGITGSIPPTLRFHPAAPWGYADDARTFPAMVAVATARDGKSAAGLHLTALKPDGSGKAPIPSSKLMMGELKGACVQLGTLQPGGDLAVAEGIETALSFRDLNGMPCWAALSAGGLQSFEPPAGTGRLFIAADGDEAGVQAATALGQRASSRRTPVVMIAAPEGQDWNDVAREAMQ